MVSGRTLGHMLQQSLEIPRSLDAAGVHRLQEEARARVQAARAAEEARAATARTLNELDAAVRRQAAVLHELETGRLPALADELVQAIVAIEDAGEAAWAQAARRLHLEAEQRRASAARLDARVERARQRAQAANDLLDLYQRRRTASRTAPTPHTALRARVLAAWAALDEAERLRAEWRAASERREVETAVARREAGADLEAFLAAIAADLERGIRPAHAEGQRPRWVARALLLAHGDRLARRATSPTLWAQWATLRARLVAAAAERTLVDYRRWLGDPSRATGEALHATIFAWGRRVRFLGRVQHQWALPDADVDLAQTAREALLGAPGYLPRARLEAVLGAVSHRPECSRPALRTTGGTASATEATRWALHRILATAHPKVQGRLRRFSASCPECDASASTTYALLYRTWCGQRVSHRLNLSASRTAVHGGCLALRARL